MIEININKNQIDRIRKWYEFNNLKNSHTKGVKQDYGALGEIIVMDYFNIPKEKYIGSKDYDLIWNNGVNKGLKVDVKTKTVSHNIASNENILLPRTSMHQNTDAYLFVAIKEDMTRAWIMGFVNQNEIWKNGQTFIKGDVDPRNVNQKINYDCIIYPVNKLIYNKWINNDKINVETFYEYNFILDKNKSTDCIYTFKEVKIYYRGISTAHAKFIYYKENNQLKIIYRLDGRVENYSNIIDKKWINALFIMKNIKKIEPV